MIRCEGLRAVVLAGECSDVSLPASSPLGGGLPLLLIDLLCASCAVKAMI